MGEYHHWYNFTAMLHRMGIYVSNFSFYTSITIFKYLAFILLCFTICFQIGELNAELRGKYGATLGTSIVALPHIPSIHKAFEREHVCVPPILLRL